MGKYIYVNYAYEDREQVQGIIENLKSQGLDVITGNVSEDRLAAASCVIHVCTPSGRTSKSYRKNMDLAIKHENDSIVLHVENGEITSDTETQMDIMYGLFKYKYKCKAAESVKQEETPQTGEAETVYLEGEKLLNGDGCEADPEMAVRYFRQSANQGDVRAQYELSMCYSSGTGVKRDMNEAAKWCEMAAYGGNVQAQSEIGYCYEYGQGVVRNIKEAVRWYTIASEQGNAEAMNNLAFCYQKGKGVQKNTKEAIRLYQEAAAAGNASAQYNLGFCCWYGEGMRPDKDKAVEWFKISASNGNTKAEQMLKILNQRSFT